MTTARAYRRRTGAGITLVELIVVLAIVLLLAAVAVPTFVRSALMTRSDIKEGARDLHFMLQAARQYAITYNVDAGVAYAVNESIDSQTDEPVPIMDALMLVRRLTPEEFRSLSAVCGVGEQAWRGSEGNIDLPFVPVRTKHGTIKTLSEQVCVLGELPAPPGLFPGYPDGPRFVGALNDPVVRGGSDQGFVPVRIYDPLVVSTTDPAQNDLNPIRPRQLRFAYYGSDVPPADRTDDLIYLNHRFPAHVFTPRATIQALNTTRTRVTLLLGPPPDADLVDRFVDAEEGTYIEPVFIPCELYLTTGRIKLDAPSSGA